MKLKLFPDRYEPPAPVQYVDPAMIGVLVGMALMFIIICVVLRLFSKYVANIVLTVRVIINSTPP